MTLPVDPQLLLDHSPVVSYVYDRKRGVFSYLSANIDTWLQLPHEQLQDNPDWLSRVVEQDRDALSQRLRDETPDAHPARFRLLAAKDRVVHVEDRPLLIDAGDGLRTGCWLNVTEAALAEAARSRADRELEDVVKDLTDIYYRTDREGNLVRVSGAALDLFAAPMEQVFGSRVADYYLEPDGREKFLQALTAAGGRLHAYQAPMRRHDGAIIWISTSAHFIYDANGQIDGVEGMVRDITVQKEAEAALRAERDFIGTVLNTVDSLVVVLNRAGEIIAFNNAAEKLTGYSFEELHHQAIWDHLILPEEVEGVKNVFANLVSGMFPNSYENYWLTKTNSKRLIAWSNACMTDSRGAVTHVVATGIDITDQRQSMQALKASEERFRELTDSIKEVFWLGSTDWQEIYYVSPAYEAIWGDSPASLYQTPLSWTERLHPDDGEAVANFIAGVDADQDELEFPEYRICRDDGSIRWISARAYPIRDEHGTPIRIAGIAEDITERHQAEEQLRQSAVAFDNTHEAIMVLDERRQIITVNRAFSVITGYSPDEAIGRLPEDMFATESLLPDGVDWTAVFSDGHWQGETWLVRTDGECFPAWVTVSPVQDQRGSLTHYVCLFSDISTIKQSQDKLDYLAHHDPLTKLPNRLLLGARLEHALQQAQRNEHQVAVLFVDLDRFKNINDSLGHTVGDKLLIQAADRLRGLVRAEDTIARLGGDEFVIVMGEQQDSQGSMLLADRITVLMRTPFAIDRHKLHLSASVGICLYPQDGNSIDALMKNADAAMYRAKEHGRDNYQFYTDELSRTALQRVNLENALRHALEYDELRLCYQPQVSLRDGRVIGAEVLVRWEHPTRGLVTPDQFIPLAEESGLILPLGEWVLHTACQQARAWLDEGFDIGRISVNISSIQIRRGDIQQVVGDALSAANLDGHHLELEITESTLMRQDAKTFKSLEALRRLHVDLAIDDFGTGYSSLSYLKMLPIDRLKIDRTFINDVGRDPNDEAIVRAIIAMAHTLQLQVVAEGVENETHHDFLRELACDAAQGHLFGRPMTADEFAQLLQLRKGGLLSGQ